MLPLYMLIPYSLSIYFNVSHIRNNLCLYFVSVQSTKYTYGFDDEMPVFFCLEPINTVQQENSVLN